MNSYKVKKKTYRNGIPKTDTMVMPTRFWS